MKFTALPASSEPGHKPRAVSLRHVELHVFLAVNSPSIGREDDWKHSVGQKFLPQFCSHFRICCFPSHTLELTPLVCKRDRASLGITKWVKIRIIILIVIYKESAKSAKEFSDSVVSSLSVDICCSVFLILAPAMRQVITSSSTALSKKAEQCWEQVLQNYCEFGVEQDYRHQVVVSSTTHFELCWPRGVSKIGKHFFRWFILGMQLNTCTACIYVSAAGLAQRFFT